MIKNTSVILVVVMLLSSGCTKHIERPSVMIDENSTTYNNGTISVYAHVTNDGGELSDAGIFYLKGVTSVPYEKGIKKSGGANNEIRLTLNNLSRGPYSICAYATNTAGTGYSNVITVGDYAVTGNYSLSSDKQSITIYGEAYAPAGTTFTRVGFIWSTDPHDGWLKEVSGFSGKTEAQFQTTHSVHPGITFYYYVMFQTNKGDTYYGERRQVTI